MSLPLLLGLGGGLTVAALNVATIRSLWRSPIFERSQKTAQTVLIWLIPGSFAVVRHLLREPSNRPTDDGDPTVSRNHGYVDDPGMYTHGHGDGGNHL
jgi:hypothetical protein